MKMERVVWLLAVLLIASGCATVRQIVGMTAVGEPSVNIKSAETRWLLIKNPRYGDVRSEPEYVWVEEDKVPTTLTTLLRGKSAIIAAPEIVAKYGTPPGGGKISPRQGVPYQTAAEQTRGARTAGSDAARSAASAGVPAPEPVKRGFVVYVDTTRIVIDLTSADGVRPGSVVSLRRDRVPIVHPVTGEVLGELDEEVATARVTELRERFSVAEVQTVAAGSQIQVRDRVLLK
jgi:flagellar assembly FlgT-like protein